MLLVISVAAVGGLCVQWSRSFPSQAYLIGLCVCLAAALVGRKVIEWKAGSVLLVFDSEMGGEARSPTLVKQWIESMDARIGDNLKENQIAIRFRVFGGPPIIYVWGNARLGNARRGYVWAFQNLHRMRWLPHALAAECKFGPKYSRDYKEDLDVSELTNILCEAHEEILVPLIAYRGGAGVTNRLRDLLSGRSEVYQSNLRTYYAQANEHVRALLAKSAAAVVEETTKNERLIALELYVTQLDRTEKLYRKFRETSRLAYSIEGVEYAGVLLDEIQASREQLDDVRAGLSKEVRHVVMLRLNQLRGEDVSPIDVTVEKQLLDDVRATLSKKQKKSPQ